MYCFSYADIFTILRDIGDEIVKNDCCGGKEAAERLDFAIHCCVNSGDEKYLFSSMFRDVEEVSDFIFAFLEGKGFHFDKLFTQKVKRLVRVSCKKVQTSKNLKAVEEFSKFRRQLGRKFSNTARVISIARVEEVNISDQIHLILNNGGMPSQVQKGRVKNLKKRLYQLNQYICDLVSVQ